MVAATDLESKHIVAEQAYGSVKVVIHDGKVAQIECREKIRGGRDEPARKIHFADGGTFDQIYQK